MKKLYLIQLFSFITLSMAATLELAHAQRTLDMEDNVYRSEHLRQMTREAQAMNEGLHHDYYVNLLNVSRIQFVDYISLSAQFSHDGTRCGFGVSRLANALVPRAYDKEFFYSVKVIKNEYTDTKHVLSLSLIPSDSDRETLTLNCEQTEQSRGISQVSIHDITQAFNQTRPLISIYQGTVAPNVPDPVKPAYDPRKDPFNFKN